MEVVELAIEPEIKEVLDDHKKILNRHDGDINDLKIFKSVTEEKLSNIDGQLNDVKGMLTRIESNSLASNATNNALLATQTSMTEVVKKLADSNTIKDTNNAEVVKTKNNNTKDITLKILGIVLFIVLGWFAMKGVTINIPAF
ncbi:hypothetical protein [Desulfitobacterium metallireducens]|uniref:Uncharacterized protein n=1 Tax=Desulfitobacterium metallireducens DSM 15288 TaxID=871968 RepID=W0ECR0_9FIRM|nr:hypothetical protein [Desulfitobacterium metallireducens]AHF08552.1 hypothetical protein DESME_08820 [Desulfitobacterium metallireducens DSM 15288]